MYNINLAQATQNLPNLLDMAIEDREVININTLKGNAIIMSEADYRGLIETLYLSSNPKLKADLIEAKNTPLEMCLDESELQW